MVSQSFSENSGAKFGGKVQNSVKALITRGSPLMKLRRRQQAFSHSDPSKKSPQNQVYSK
jgi:hypothetical protein